MGVPAAPQCLDSLVSFSECSLSMTCQQMSAVKIASASLSGPVPLASHGPGWHDARGHLHLGQVLCLSICKRDLQGPRLTQPQRPQRPSGGGALVATLEAMVDSAKKTTFRADIVPIFFTVLKAPGWQGQSRRNAWHGRLALWRSWPASWSSVPATCSWLAWPSGCSALAKLHP